MDADDRLRLDYEQTTQLMRTLTDIRFKLLAFVPVDRGRDRRARRPDEPSSVLLAVGLLGLAATLGILLYELRNAQIFDSLVERAAMLEQKLGLGLFNERPRDERDAVRHASRPGTSAARARLRRCARRLDVPRVWGALRALDVGGARKVGALVGVAAWALVVVDVERIASPRSRVRRPRNPADVRQMPINPAQFTCRPSTVTSEPRGRTAGRSARLRVRKEVDDLA